MKIDVDPNGIVTEAGQTDRLRKAIVRESKLWGWVYDNAFLEVRGRSEPDWGLNDGYMAILIKVARLRQDSEEVTRLETVRKDISKEREG